MKIWLRCLLLLIMGHVTLHAKRCILKKSANGIGTTFPNACTVPCHRGGDSVSPIFLCTKSHLFVLGLASAEFLWGSVLPGFRCWQWDQARLNENFSLAFPEISMLYKPVPWGPGVVLCSPKPPWDVHLRESPLLLLWPQISVGCCSVCTESPGTAEGGSTFLPWPSHSAGRLGAAWVPCLLWPLCLLLGVTQGGLWAPGQL